MITVTYACEHCTDDACDESGCLEHQTAARIYAAATRLARIVNESGLPEDQRRRVAVIFADALIEALGLCSTRLDRASFMEACRIEVTP